MARVVTSSQRRSKKHQIFLPLVAIAILAVGAFVLLSHDDKKVQVETAEEVVKEQPKAKPPTPIGAQEVKENSTAVVKPTKHDASSNTNTHQKKAGEMRLPDGRLFTFPAPTPGKPRIVIVDGKTYECDHEGNFKDVTPRQLFSTAFEANFMGLAIENGSFIPAFLVGLNQDEVVKILKKDYQMIGDETDEEIKKIEAYLEMKGLALDYIENGGTFDDFVVEIASFVKAERVVRAQGLKQVMGLVKEGKIAEAKALADELNESISKEGYKPLNIPPHVRKAFDELDAANDDK